MNRAPNPYLEKLWLAIDHRDELADEMVFLAGCATGLLETPYVSPPLPVTQELAELPSKTNAFPNRKTPKPIRTLLPVQLTTLGLVLKGVHYFR